MNSMFLIYCVKPHLDESEYLMHKIFTGFCCCSVLDKEGVFTKTFAFKTRKKYYFVSSEMN